MNKTEAAFAHQLGLLYAAGQIISSEFEPIKLNLGQKCWYTPDFFGCVRMGAESSTKSRASGAMMRG